MNILDAEKSMPFLFWITPNFFSKIDALPEKGRYGDEGYMQKTRRAEKFWSDINTSVCIIIDTLEKTPLPQNESKKGAERERKIKW